MVWPQAAAKADPMVQAIPPIATTTVPSLTDEVQKYLQSKNSPLAPESAFLVQQKHWKLIIAISDAESSFCKHQLFFNCWGIKAGPGQPHTDQGYAKYKSLQDAIKQTNDFIEKWQAKGKWLTPEQMNCSYVVPCSPNWLHTVKTILQELNNF